jgi:hypothetical protein
VWAVKNARIEAWSVALDGTGDVLEEDWEGVDGSIRDHLLAQELEGLEAYNLDLRLEDAKATSLVLVM